MITKHVAFVGLLAAGLLNATLCAQEFAPSPARPGGIWNGRYIGFVPKHEKAQHSVCSDNCAGGACCDSAGDAGFEVAGPTFAGPVIADSNVVVGCTPLVWARIDYLAWWTRGMDVPPLVTTSPSDTSAANAGILGAPGTSTLLGADRLNEDIRSGGRISLGRVMNPETGTGIDVTYLGLSEESQAFAANAGDLAILARPFFNTVLEENDARLIAFPNLVEGSVAVTSSTEFHTFEAVLRRRIMCGYCDTAEIFGGYRYAVLDDLVRIDEMTVSLGGPTIGSTFLLTDRFETQNEFNGGEIGIRWVRQARSCWSLEATALIALGNTHGEAAVQGETVSANRAGQSTTTEAGLLVQGTNRGTFESDEFSGIIELGLSLRRQFAPGWSARFGYNYFYWSDVLRAGDQIDLNVNTTQIPPGNLDGDPAPVFPFRTSDFWAHGFNAGLEYRY